MQGQLTELQRQQFERALKHSPELQKAVAKQHDQLHRSGGMTPSSSVRQHLLNAIKPTSENRFAAYEHRLQTLFDLPKKVVREHLKHLDQPMASVNEHSADWSVMEKGNIHLLHFDGGASLEKVDCGFVVMQAGAVFPTHQHKGNETALVIQGEITTDDGQRYLPGDVCLQEKGAIHRLKSSPNGITIFAVVIFSGLEFLDAEQQG